MKPLSVIGLALAATLFLNLGSSHAAPSLRAAENWCRLHPDARESGQDDEHLISIRECADRLMAAHAPASEQWTDAHAYCRAVGTVDAPDRRYVGPKEPHGIRDLFDGIG